MNHHEYLLKSASAASELGMFGKLKNSISSGAEKVKNSVGAGAEWLGGKVNPTLERMGVQYASDANPAVRAAGDALPEVVKQGPQYAQARADAIREMVTKRLQHIGAATAGVGALGLGAAGYAGYNALQGQDKTAGVFSTLGGKVNPLLERMGVQYASDVNPVVRGAGDLLPEVVKQGPQYAQARAEAIRALLEKRLGHIGMATAGAGALGLGGAGYAGYKAMGGGEE